MYLYIHTLYYQRVLEFTSNDTSWTWRERCAPTAEMSPGLVILRPVQPRCAKVSKKASQDLETIRDPVRYLMRFQEG